MRDALAAALGDRAALVFAQEVADVPLIRAAAEDHAIVLVVLSPTVPDLDRAMLLAAVAVLAVEIAPCTRIATLDVRAGAVIDDVVAAGVFLTTAESTTGQILQIAPR